MSPRDLAKVARACLACALLAALAATAAAQQALSPEPDYSPPRVARAEISVPEALRLALEHEPNILLAAEDAAARAGLARQASGAFDLTLLGSFQYEFVQTELSAAQKAEERDRRNELASEADDAQRDAERLTREIEQLLALRAALQQGTPLPPVEFTDLVTQSQWDTLLALYNNAPPDQKAQVIQDIIRWIDDEVTQLTAERDIAATLAEGLRDKLRKLGRIPEVQQQQRGTVDLQLQKRFRTGIVLSPFLTLTGDSLRYMGKPRSAEYGGPGSMDTYTSSLGFSVTLPLGRGRGVESAGAAERSARIDWEASRDTLAHTASQSLYTVLLAYWDLVAAQRTLDVHRRSLELQRRLEKLVEALIEADELPRAERARMEARMAEVQASVDAARRTLHQARVTFATAVGLAVSGPQDAPLAADPFPPAPVADTVARLDEAALGDLAVRRRLDLAAARQLELSGKVLWRAAQIDLASKRDLEVRVWYSGLHDTGGSVWDGVGDTLAGNWTGPSARVAFQWEKPFANDVQVGRFEERAAIARQRAIAARDLERTIRARVVQSVGMLRQAVAQLAAARSALEAYREAFRNEMEKLRYGRSTLIDTILTDQRTVQAELTVVSAERTVAQLLAQLRYETGTLVERQEDGTFRVAAAPLAPPPAG